MHISLSHCRCRRSVKGTSSYHILRRNRLFEGRVKLAEAFQPLVQAAEQILELDDAKRAHTLLRGRCRWEKSGRRELSTFPRVSGSLQRLLRPTRSPPGSIRHHVDPSPGEPGRQVGWVEEPAPEYVCDVVRIAVRKRKPHGQWGIAVPISSLLPTEVGELTGVEGDQNLDPASILLAHVYHYDQRGGGVETSFKGDKQGLGASKRNKKCFETQQIVMFLGTLAHNVVVWAQRWLAASAPILQPYGLMRMGRDVFHSSGFLLIDAQRRIRQIVLNQDASLARVLLGPLRVLLDSTQVVIQVGQT